MTSSSCRDAKTHPHAPLVAGVVTTGTLAVAFSLLALGVESFWVAFPVGFGAVLPLSLGVLHSRQATPAQTPGRQAERGDEAALDELRVRYAQGDLTDDEFERRVERLLETAETGDGTPKRHGSDHTRR